MEELRKFVAPEFVYGEGALDLAGRYAANFGARKVLVVSDPGIVAVGWVDRVLASLDTAGIAHTLFTEVSCNPRAGETMQGAARFSAEGCDVIVAVGGGSPMDCAKGIGIAYSNNVNVLKFEGIDNVPTPGPPLICIPTTAGTSADLSQFAIINDSERLVKIAIISKTVVPDAALIDPNTTTTMDRNLTACTGLDALVHAIEAYVSSANSPLTDLHAMEAIRLLHGNLLDVLENPQDITLRSRIMRGSMLAGLAFSNTSLGAVHAMAHSLGGLLDLPHGECNSILLDHVMAFNMDHALDRYCEIGRAMGLRLEKMSVTEQRRAVLDEVASFKRSAGINKKLGERGVKTTDIAALAKNAINDPCMVTNPRRPVQRDIEVIYEEAL